MRTKKIAWFLAALCIVLLGISAGEYAHLGSTSHTSMAPSTRVASPPTTSVEPQATTPEQFPPHTGPVAPSEGPTPVKAVPPATSPEPTNSPVSTHGPAPTPGATAGHSTAPTHSPAPTLGAAAAHNETRARNARPEKRPTTPGRAPTRHDQANPVYMVQPHDTLWDLAANHLGNAYRWDELFDLNRGRSEPNGDFVDPNLIYVGWTLKFPVGATGFSPEPAPIRGVDPVYVVQPGDTLWALAAAHLGSPYRWSELFDLNRDRAEPGGRLVDPNLIYVGWTLKFPMSATGFSTDRASIHAVETRGLENRATSPGRTVLDAWSGLAKLRQQTSDGMAGWSI